MKDLEPRLNELRQQQVELLQRFDVGLSEVAFAARLESDSALREAVQTWLQAEPQRPEHVSAADWLSFEQDKHEKLLAAA